MQGSLTNGRNKMGASVPVRHYHAAGLINPSIRHLCHRRVVRQGNQASNLFPIIAAFDAYNLVKSMVLIGG